MQRMKSSPDRPTGRPPSPWLAGMAIGLTIMGMASSAIVLGAGWALSRPTDKDK
jgi:hypothetical protein